MTDNKVDDNEALLGSASTADATSVSGTDVPSNSSQKDYFTDSFYLDEHEFRHGPIKTYHGRTLGERFGINTFVDFSFSRSLNEIKQASRKVEEAFKIAQESDYDRVFDSVVALLDHFDKEVVIATIDHIPSVFAFCRSKSFLLVKKANEKLIMPLCRLVMMSPKVQNGVLHALSQLVADDNIGIHELQCYVIPWLFDFMLENVPLREPVPPLKAGEVYNNNRPVVVTLLHKIGLKLDQFPFQWVQTFFAPRFSTLLSDQTSIPIRRMAIQTMGAFAAVFGPNFIEKKLLPHLQKAVHDPNERIRKAVCDILPEVAQHASPEVRNTKLVKLFNTLVKDSKRHVQHYALQKIGTLVLIFADPAINNLDYDDGNVVKIDPERVAELKQNAAAEALKRESLPLPIDFEMPYSERPSTPSPSTSSVVKADEEVVVVNHAEQDASADKDITLRVRDSTTPTTDRLHLDIVDRTNDDCPGLTDFEAEHGPNALFDDDPLNASFIDSEQLNIEGIVLTEADLDNADAAVTKSESFDSMAYWRLDVQVSEDEFARYENKSATMSSSIASNDAVLSKASCDLSSAGLGSPEKNNSSIQDYMRHQQFWDVIDSEDDEPPPFPNSGAAPLASADSDDDDEDDDNEIVVDDDGRQEDEEEPDFDEIPDGELDGNEEFQQATLTHGEDDDLLDIADVGPGQVSPCNSRMYTSSQFSSRSSLPSPRHSSSSDTHTLQLSGMTHAERLSRIIDACLSAEERAAVKNRKQKVLPDRLFYTLMNASVPVYDNHDVMKEVARSLPAIVYTFGASNWIFIKSFYYSFAHHSSSDVRQIVAKGLHKVAAILSAEDVDRDLVPLFKDLIYDDESAIYMSMLSNFSEFVFYLSAKMRVIMLRNLNNYLSVETTRNWRLRELFAAQCLKLCELYWPEEINDGISCFALTFMDDNIGSVRERGAELLAKVFSIFIHMEYPSTTPYLVEDPVETKMSKILDEMPLTKSLLVDSRRGFFNSSAWRRRQTWAQVLLQIIKQNTESMLTFTTIFANDILCTANDRIPNTRIKFCQICEVVFANQKDGTIMSIIDPEISSVIFAKMLCLAENDTDFGVQMHAKMILGEIGKQNELNYADQSARVMICESSMWDRLHCLYEEKRKQEMVLPPTPSNQDGSPSSTGSSSVAPLMEQLAGQFPRGKKKITSLAGSIVNMLPVGKKSPNKFLVQSVPEHERSPPAYKSSIVQQVEADKKKEEADKKKEEAVKKVATEVESSTASTSAETPQPTLTTPSDKVVKEAEQAAKETDSVEENKKTAESESYFLPGEEVELDDDRCVPPGRQNPQIEIQIDDEQTDANASPKKADDIYPEVDC